MSLEAAIFDILAETAAVTALVGGSRTPRISPIHRAQGKAVPAIIYQQISSDDEVTCDGHIGPREDRVQVNCWAATPAAARSLAEVVRTALSAASGSHGSVTVRYCSIADEGDIWEIDERAEAETVYGKRQDWIICYEA